MRFLELEIDNFGPYYDKTSISLNNGKNGVTIFWGNNGRGKTTLLNAFRFALYGEIKRRNNLDVKYYDMINKIGLQEGKSYFSISLKIQDEDDVFTLIRKYSLKNGKSFSERNEDYEFQTYLKKNNAFLSKPETDKYIKNLLPIDISRFFLFDGELLQEYESLLDDDDIAGDKIKESIEKILGLPYLTNGLIDCDEYLKTIDTLKKKAIQSDKKVESFSATYNSILEEIEAHRNSIAEAKADLDKLRQEKKALETKMSETELARRYLSDIENKQIDIKGRESQIESYKNQLKTITRDSWKYQIKDKVDSLISELNKSIKTLKDKEVKTQIDNNFLTLLDTAVKECECPLCSQILNKEVIALINDKIKNIKSDTSISLSDDEKRQLTELQSRLSHLQSLKMADYTSDINQVEEAIESNIIAIADAKSIINNQRNKLDNLDYDKQDGNEILKYPKLYADCEAKIKNLNETITKEDDKILELNSNRIDIEKKINQQTASKELQTLTKKSDLVKDICNIFEEAIDSFRLKLKNNVQRDATELFKKLSAEKEYEKLQINDNYGLSIINTMGIEAPNRSAGYEHIVALSLIGALHKNAPLKGPIIMDSPFGRLDPDNKKNVCKVLPDLADQVLLLMYNDEIDGNLLREILNNNLIDEKNLVRVESMKTRIE